MKKRNTYQNRKVSPDRPRGAQVVGHKERPGGRPQKGTLGNLLLRVFSSILFLLLYLFFVPEGGCSFLRPLRDERNGTIKSGLSQVLSKLGWNRASVLNRFLSRDAGRFSLWLPADNAAMAYTEGRSNSRWSLSLWLRTLVALKNRSHPAILSFYFVLYSRQFWSPKLKSVEFSYKKRWYIMRCATNS